jgi:5-oxoprolinase (ATP-hydrolysing)
MKQWFFAVDRGGTFTDIIGIDPANKIHTSKILSDSSAHSESGEFRQLRDPNMLRNLKGF